MNEPYTLPWDIANDALLALSGVTDALDRIDELSRIVAETSEAKDLKSQDASQLWIAMDRIAKLARTISYTAQDYKELVDVAREKLEDAMQEVPSGVASGASEGAGNE